METIAFTEHQALLGKQEAEIKLSFSEQIKSFKEQVADLTVKVEEATAKVVAASAEVAKVQAESVVAVEAARAEGVIIGTRDGKAESERVFNEKLERQEISAFCDGLVKSGKISQAELTPEGKHPLADVLFSLPSEHRESMKTLLSNRPALASFGEHKAATLPAGSPPSGGAITDESLMSKASELRASNPSMQFRESITTAKALLEKGE
jgi:hypothetical protein